MAWLDAHLAGDQEVADSIPAVSGKILLLRWSWNIFYCHSSPSADSRRAVVSFWQKNAHKYWLPLRGLIFLGKWLGKLTTLDMTLISWLGHKTSTQSIKILLVDLFRTLIDSMTWIMNVIFTLSFQTGLNKESRRWTNAADCWVWSMSVHLPLICANCRPRSDFLAMFRNISRY